MVHSHTRANLMAPVDLTEQAQLVYLVEAAAEEEKRRRRPGQNVNLEYARQNFQETGPQNKTTCGQNVNQSKTCPWCQHLKYAHHANNLCK